MMPKTSLRLPSLRSSRAAAGVAGTAAGFSAGVLWAAQRVRHGRATRASAQQDLARAEELAKRYLNVAGTMLLVLDCDGIVTIVNQTTCDTIGRTNDELIGREWFALALPPETLARDRAVHHQVMQYGVDAVAGRATSTNEVVHADGTRIAIQWRGEVLHNPDGSPAGLVCAGTDLTKQREAEAVVERARVELEQLRRLAQQVASLDDARQAVVEATTRLAGARYAAITEPSPDDPELLVTTTSTLPELVGYTVELGTGTATQISRCIQSGEPRFVGPPEQAHHVRVFASLKCVSILHQPILGPAGPIGVLSVGWDHEIPSLQQRESELVGLAADEAASALGRLTALAQLKHAALVDPLTGVRNRRAFDAALPSELGVALDSGRPLSLVMMDLNDFKLVNDHSGHVAGDELLIAACVAWQSALRSGDRLSRIGGDEFAVILPDCDERVMTDIIARLRRATPAGTSASIGGAIWNGNEDPSGLMRRADMLQYADKADLKRRRGDHHRSVPVAPTTSDEPLAS